MIDAEYEIQRAREDFDKSWHVKPYGHHYQRWIDDLESTIRAMAREREEAGRGAKT